MHICVSKLTIISSYNGLSPRRRQAIIWTNAGILLIRPLGTKFSEILITIHTFSFMKMHLKMSSAKWWPFCLGLNVLNAPTGLNKNLHNFIVFSPSVLDFEIHVLSCCCIQMSCLKHFKIIFIMFSFKSYVKGLRLPSWLIVPLIIRLIVTLSVIPKAVPSYIHLWVTVEKHFKINLIKCTLWTHLFMEQGMSLWWPLLELLSWCPIFKSCLCNSFEDRTPYISSTGAQSSNELHRLDCMTGYQDSSPNNGCQVLWLIRCQDGGFT